MAESFFNKLIRSEAIGISAGTQPTDSINPVVVEVMREIGIDISTNKPKLLTIEMVKQADKMITMGCGAEAGAVCPVGFIEMEDWKLDDPKGKSIEDVRRIRDEIKIRVETLIKEMM
jgi:protein-tyrosine-phosphatase